MDLTAQQRKEKLLRRIQNLTDSKERLKELTQKWREHEAQRKILKAIYARHFKRIFIRGGRKSGKTEIELYVPVRQAGLFPKSACLIVGPKLNQQKKIIWENRRLQDFAPKSWKATPNEQKSTIRYPNGSFIQVDGADNYDDHRGPEYDVVVVDEAKDHGAEITAAVMPNLAPRNGIFLFAGSPPRNRKSFYGKLEQTALRSHKLYQGDEPAKSSSHWFHMHMRCWDNPHISRTWLEETKAEMYEDGDGDIWEQEYEALWVKGGKKVTFPMFDYEEGGAHVYPHDLVMSFFERDAHKLEYFCIADPGTSSVFGVLIIAYNKYNGHVYVLDELYIQDRYETTTASVCEKLRAKEEELIHRRASTDHVYDEAGAWFGTEAIDHGYSFSPTNKSDNPKKTGFSIIKELMKQGRIFISARCENLIVELTDHISEHNVETGKEKEIGADHLIDCLRYFVARAGITLKQSPVQVVRPDSRRAYTLDEDLRNGTADDFIRDITEDHQTVDF